MDIGNILLGLEPVTSFVSAIGVLIAIGMSAIAIIMTNKTSQKLTHDTAYKDIDDQITDFMKMAVEYPQLRDIKKTTNFENTFVGDDKIRYEAYANICWNVCEAIFDKLILSNGVTQEIKDTWEPVIRVENYYHRKWLIESIHGFKGTFLVYMGLKEPETSAERNVTPLNLKMSTDYANV